MGNPDYPVIVVSNIKQHIKSLDKYDASHILIYETKSENYTTIAAVLLDLGITILDVTKLIQGDRKTPDKEVFLFRLAPCQLNDVMAELAMRGLTGGLWAFGEGYTKLRHGIDERFT